MPRRKTTEEFKNVYIAKFGNIYDLNKVDYINAHTNVIITCHCKDKNGVEHGDFKATPNNMLNGHGCPVCGGSKRKTQEYIIEEFKKLHEDRYIYSNFKYINMHSSSNIICKEHGMFSMTAHEHLKGQGCPICARRKRTVGLLIEDMRKVHKDKYSYDLITEFNGTHSDIPIICPIHGYFKTNPSYHLRGGGCKRCNFPVTSTETFKEEGNRVHKGKYNYDKSIYIDSKTPICITCPIHGDFWQVPTEHIRGYGCKKCSKSKLEEEMEEELIKNNIRFQLYSHDFNLGCQSLDFYLLDYNIAIECQGIQHFQNHPFFYKNKIESVKNKVLKCFIIQRKSGYQQIHLMIFFFKEFIMKRIFLLIKKS